MDKEAKGLKLTIRWDQFLCHGYSSTKGVVKNLHSSHGTGFAKLLSGDSIYDRLQDYISGDREGVTKRC